MKYRLQQGNDKVLSTLDMFGFNATRLTEEAGELEELADLDSAQEVAKAAYNKSTEVRDEAADDLRAWLRRGETVARIALKGEPHVLKALGLK